MKKILLDNTEYHFSVHDAPFLIHGVDHTGASIFTVTLVADLYRQGTKILFLSGYHMARDEFSSQINDSSKTILAKATDTNEVLETKQVIFVQKEDSELFIKLTKELSDINERVILIKNIDLFSEKVFDSVTNLTNVIISADIDKCSYKDKILMNSYKTKMFFSKLESNDNIKLPRLEKYQGYFLQQDMTGFLSLQM